MSLRRAIVSHDATINSAAISGTGRLRRELSFGIGHRPEGRSPLAMRQVAVNPTNLKVTAKTGYVSRQTSSMRQPLKMLLTIRVSPLTRLQQCHRKSDEGTTGYDTDFQC